MTPKKLWITNGVLLGIYFIIHYSLTEYEAFSENLSLTAFVTTVVILVVGVTIGALAALIPFSQKKYWQKFKITFPICTLLPLIGLLFIFGTTAFIGHANGIIYYKERKGKKDAIQKVKSFAKCGEFTYKIEDNRIYIAEFKGCIKQTDKDSMRILTITLAEKILQTYNDMEFDIFKARFQDNKHHLIDSIVLTKKDFTGQ